jgi:hypothetical protein
LGEKPSFLALGTPKMAKRSGFRPQTGQFNGFYGKNRVVLERSTVFFVLLICQKVAKRRGQGIKSSCFFVLFLKAGGAGPCHRYATRSPWMERGEEYPRIAPRAEHRDFQLISQRSDIGIEGGRMTGTEMRRIRLIENVFSLRSGATGSRGELN